MISSQGLVLKLLPSFQIGFTILPAHLIQVSRLQSTNGHQEHRFPLSLFLSHIHQNSQYGMRHLLRPSRTRYCQLHSTRRIKFVSLRLLHLLLELSSMRVHALHSEHDLTTRAGSSIRQTRQLPRAADFRATNFAKYQHRNKYLLNKKTMKQRRFIIILKLSKIMKSNKMEIDNFLKL